MSLAALSYPAHRSRSCWLPCGCPVAALAAGDEEGAAAGGGGGEGGEELGVTWQALVDDLESLTPGSRLWDVITPHFYAIFWTLSLDDIYWPEAR